MGSKKKAAKKEVSYFGQGTGKQEILTDLELSDYWFFSLGRKIPFEKAFFFANSMASFTYFSPLSSLIRTFGF